MPRATAYASMQQARKVLVVMMLGALALIVVIVLRSTRQLVSRLEETHRAREELKGQLFNAAKLASVGEMAAGVAHEINNPLAIIYEEAGVLRDSLNPAYGRELTREELVERLDAISASAMRGRTITRKLLAFARQHDPNPELLDVNELVEHVLAMKDTEFSVSNIEVTRDYQQELPSIHASRNQLEQVLLNLLNNARDALDGAGKLQVRTSADERFVRIDVEDNGCGMSPEQMEKVFFPFYTTKAVGKGTGLGLSISYGIVKTHGGKIEVSSKVGVGTTFTVVLPSARRQGPGGVHAPGKE
jgi:two-component system NtrC family sensor kinase